MNTYGANSKIVSGRHCYEGFAYNADTQAIIDVSMLKGFGYDSSKGYWLEAGLSNWEAMQILLNNFNKCVPGGSCYSVGLGGHISGGGYGLLSRLHGLTIDWGSGIDIVTYDYSTRTATLRYVADTSTDVNEQNLFWALRGAGGGNFGVICRCYFKALPAAPASARLYTWAINWSDIPNLSVFANIVRNWENEYATQEPQTWGTFSLLKLTHQASGQMAILTQTLMQPPSLKSSNLPFASTRLRLYRAC